MKFLLRLTIVWFRNEGTKNYDSLLNVLLTSLEVALNDKSQM